MRELVLERNQRWLPLIEAVATSTPSFISCGLFHVPDLLAKLSQQGFQVEEVLYKMLYLTIAHRH